MAKHSHRDEQKPHDDALPHEHAPEKDDNDESSYAAQAERSDADLVRPDENDTNAEVDAKDEGDSSDEGGSTDEASSTAAGDDADPTDSPEARAAGHVVRSAQSGASQSKLQRFKHWFGGHKKLTIPGCIILALAVLAAVPFTRYWLAGLVLKQQLSVVVDDSVTNKPVSNATLSINGQQATTDGQGHAAIKTKVGRARLTVSKNYYQSASQSVLVPILKQKGVISLKVKATGRQVSVTVVNKLTKKPVASATIAALDTKASTDKNGVAVLVLPADKQTVDGTISANGYNVLPQKIIVTTDEKANNVALTPSGNVYFLSDQSGTLDVVKTNLDGSNHKVVVAGTGKEDKRGTVLLASRDWKYLALLSKRDGGDNAKLYLIDTSNDSMVVMDEGTAQFSLTGWSDHRFIYTVTRTNVELWQDNRQALKSYDADSKSIATIDQVGGVGDNILTSYEDFGTPYILKNEIVYTTQWHAQQNPGSYSIQTWQLWRDGVNARKAELHSVHPDGSGGHVVKSYAPTIEPNAPYANPVTVTLYTRSYEPQSVWILVDSSSVDEYENGQAKAQPDVKPTDFWAQDYPTYLISPSSNSTFWNEARDGKETLLVGDSDAKNGQAIAKLTDYAAYGWYTDQYILVTKSGSELYIMPAGGGDAIKLADYYKPFVNFSGYGYGYGGL